MFFTHSKMAVKKLSYCRMPGIPRGFLHYTCTLMLGFGSQACHYDVPPVSLPIRGLSEEQLPAHQYQYSRLYVAKIFHWLAILRPILIFIIAIICFTE